jgi:hypothetical protein
MSTPGPRESLNARGTPATNPTPYPLWVWVVLASLAGAYAGWEGADLWSWPSALGLIGTMICLGSIGAFYDRLVRLRSHLAHPGLALLAVLVVYGLIGGFVAGLVYLFWALFISALVAWISDRNLRVAAGTIAGALA